MDTLARQKVVNNLAEQKETDDPAVNAVIQAAIGGYDNLGAPVPVSILVMSICDTLALNSCNGGEKNILGLIELQEALTTGVALKRMEIMLQRTVVQALATNTAANTHEVGRHAHIDLEDAFQEAFFAIRNGATVFDFITSLLTTGVDTETLRHFFIESDGHNILMQALCEAIKHIAAEYYAIKLHESPILLIRYTEQLQQQRAPRYTDTKKPNGQAIFIVQNLIAAGIRLKDLMKIFEIRSIGGNELKIIRDAVNGHKKELVSQWERHVRDWYAVVGEQTSITQVAARITEAIVQEEYLLLGDIIDMLSSGNAFTQLQTRLLKIIDEICGKEGATSGELEIGTDGKYTDPKVEKVNAVIKEFLPRVADGRELLSVNLRRIATTRGEITLPVLRIIIIHNLALCAGALIQAAIQEAKNRFGVCYELPNGESAAFTEVQEMKAAIRMSKLERAARALILNSNPDLETGIVTFARSLFLADFNLVEVIDYIEEALKSMRIHADVNLDVSEIIRCTFRNVQLQRHLAATERAA